MSDILELKKKLVKVKAEITLGKNKDLTAARKIRREIARLMGAKL
jgi:ribosomal protein L29